MDHKDYADHPVMTAFAAAGYPSDMLTEPADVTADEIDTGAWRVVQWNNHGIEMFDVYDAHEDDWSPGGVHVEFGERGTQLPIDFERDAPYEVPTMKHLRARASPSVVFLVETVEEGRQIVSFDRREAVEALALWGSEGWVPKLTADAMCKAFDTGPLTRDAFRDDPHAKHVEIVRSPLVVRSLVAATAYDTKRPDSGISGHKKRRRQAFHRNLDVLKDVVGIESDD